MKGVTTEISVTVVRGLRNGLVAGFLAIAVALPAFAPANPAIARAAPESFADLAEKLLPAVVNISTTQTITASGNERTLPPGTPFEEFFKEFEDRMRPDGERRSRRAQSLGSGFIVDKSGYVVTNNHVIKDADEIVIRMQDDTEFEAELVGTDPKTDIALLKFDPAGTDLPVVKFGDSDKMRVGDWVVAIGNPFGLGGTVTAGIVSARGRDIGQGPYDDFIQTDAAINKGNSGGPLFNIDGEVIGVNTVIFSQSGGSVGIGFAVSAALADPVVAQLQEFGRTRRGWLGVRIQEVTEEVAESLSLDSARGALVAHVNDQGPAKAAGIKAGDVILKFNNRSVDTMRELPRIVARTPIGKDVPVEIWRGGKKVNVTANIGELEEAEKQALLTSGGPMPAPAELDRVESLGLQLSTISDEMRGKFGLDTDVSGVVITEVDPDGPAARDLRAGDVIVEVQQDPVSSPDGVQKGISAARSAGKKSVLLTVNRGGEMRFVALRITEG
ncbi:DegQ family serine endoprotease [Nisaea acidiphila]|uniref:Probable periplasmic serine endoprotease DegP-like n=1 Tax=Nisaea acidiphila TaxID=1862145 RepID=A0A9J7ASK0_9PROT|nr:DegQ family serine endoprotease [Nisaea acidiphila]UUX49481.1 DegQ family serine endoprotease [Nisaea acidiphila]